MTGDASLAEAAAERDSSSVSAAKTRPSGETLGAVLPAARAHDKTKAPATAPNAAQMYHAHPQHQPRRENGAVHVEKKRAALDDEYEVESDAKKRRRTDAFAEGKQKKAPTTTTMAEFYDHTQQNRNRVCRGWSGPSYRTIFQLAIGQAIEKTSSQRGGFSTKILTHFPLPGDFINMKDADKLEVVTDMVDSRDENGAPSKVLSFVLRSINCQPISLDTSMQKSLCDSCAAVTKSVALIKNKASKLPSSNDDQKARISALRKEKLDLHRNAKKREDRLRSKVASLKEKVESTATTQPIAPTHPLLADARQVRHGFDDRDRMAHNNDRTGETEDRGRGYENELVSPMRRRN